MRLIYLICLLSVTARLSAQETSIYNDDPLQRLPIGTEFSEYKIRQSTGLTEVTARVEPPNWWVGMQEETVEVLIYDRLAGDYTNATIDYPGVTVNKITTVANPNYLFLSLRIAPGTVAGDFTIGLSGPNNTKKEMPYRLLPHPRDSQGRSQLSSADFMYLIMPDRFANGDPTNDTVEGMAQTGTNRDKVYFRHGGDLKGVIDKLDYLSGLGITAIWLNPVLENNQPYESYHGYAITDHYRIDRRFGSNETYQQLVEAAHERGIKVIMDIIFNHVGDNHYLINDLPDTTWIHQWPIYTQTTYRATTLLDPHASDRDRRLMTDGWFDKHMPDLDQTNPQLANYLIQNSIWWSLYSGQDGFRIDTYAYPDPDFMAEWNRRLLQEVPDLGIFGETWVHGPAVQAWFAGGRGLHDDFDTYLPGVTDFQLYYAIHEALSSEPGWTDGVLRLYYTLAQDYLYKDANKNVTFLDNHDINRLFTTLGQDTTKMKSALSLLLTLRGIPMINYGTELAFEGAGGGFGEGGRIDFPGGFPEDTQDKFSPDNRSGTEKAIFDFTKYLANYRKSSPALTEGTLTQFVPVDGVYVYLRESPDQRVMVIFNGNGEARKQVTLDPYADVIGATTTGKDITNGSAPIDLQVIDLAAKEVRIIELK